MEWRGWGVTVDMIVLLHWVTCKECMCVTVDGFECIALTYTITQIDDSLTICLVMATWLDSLELDAQEAKHDVPPVEFFFELVGSPFFSCSSFSIDLVLDSGSFFKVDLPEVALKTDRDVVRLGCMNILFSLLLVPFAWGMLWMRTMTTIVEQIIKQLTWIQDPQLH